MKVKWHGFWKDEEEVLDIICVDRLVAKTLDSYDRISNEI